MTEFLFLYAACGMGVAEGCVYASRKARSEFHWGAYVLVCLIWPVFLGRFIWEKFR